MPDSASVIKSWNDVARNEFSSVASDLSLLTKNQRVLLQTMAQYDEVSAPSSKSFLMKAGMAQGSVLQSLSTLVKKDFVEQSTTGYKLIDPLMKYILIELSS